jgi:hypothetical protein
MKIQESLLYNISESSPLNTEHNCNCEPFVCAFLQLCLCVLNGAHAHVVMMWSTTYYYVCAFKESPYV